MFVAPFVLLAIPGPLPQQPWPPLRPIYTGRSLGISLSDGIASVDLDVDGHIDLLSWSEFGPHVRFHLGTGAGTFSSDAWPALTLSPPEYLTSLAVGDFDGDGSPDSNGAQGYASGAASISPRAGRWTCSRGGGANGDP